jgi:hypothetical protein
MLLRSRSAVVLVALAMVFMAAATPAQAQRDFEPLFDKFNFSVQASWMNISTEIGLDSETLGEGTTLNFEDDLGLSSGEAIPTLAFEWQIARKHRLAVRWQDIKRDSTAQALTEIQWGDETFPINAAVTLAFDLTQYFIDYTYYPWVKEKWAVGFGLGLRWMDLYAELKLEEETIGEGGDNISQAAPLPYIYFEYRRVFSDHWRFIAGLGWLSLTFDDISGGNYVGRASIEYLVGKRWSFGGAINLSNVNVDVENIENEAGDPEFTARLDMSVNDFSVFARVRF